MTSLYLSVVLTMFWGLLSTDLASCQTWTQLSGQAVDISARDLTIPAWVVNQAGNLYSYNSATDSWTLEQSSIKNVGQAFDGSVWLVTTTNTILLRQTNGQYSTISGSLVQVAGRSADEAVGVNSADQIWHYIEGGWHQMPGSGTWAAIGSDGTIWVVNRQQQIFHWNFDTNAWDQVAGAAVNIDAYNSQRVIVTNAQGNMYIWTGSGWSQLTGQCVQASITATRYYCVNSAGNIYRSS